MAKKYEVWGKQGQGSVCVAEFKSKSKAIQYVINHWGQMSFMVKKPNGKPMKSLSVRVNLALASC